MSIVYSVFDRVSGLYGNLNQSPNIESAKRNIKLSFLRDPMLEASKDDYDLVMLGEFDERSGDLVNLSKPYVLPVSKIIFGDKGAEVNG